ncbi:MAG: beta strand repeat-containing protein, partial [Verrucomicrobiales bacterium]
MMERLSPCLRRQKHFQKIVLMALLPSLAILSSPLQANPAGGLVVNGSATIGDGLGGHLSINQLTDKAIINWEDFSISAGELTQFIQPGSGSAVLNRVVTGNPSAIHGALRANGKVMVINPNGILVGATGSIDVGGLVLSTLDVSDADFLGGGDMVFKGNTSAGVVNYGRINAVGGDVFLIGKSVTNTGGVTASNGTVGLAAGQEVLISAAPNAEGERVFVRTTSGASGGTGVENSGTIEGASVELKAHGNMFALAINNKGSIRATGSVSKGGKVFLRAPGGRVDNSGSIRATVPGGNGGRILIEGSIVNAGGTINADGEGSGDGGQIELLGDQINVLAGAKITANGKNGGSVQVGEVGVTQSVNVAGGSVVSANGNSGKGGMVNMQAVDINVAGGATISADGATSGGTLQIGTPGFTRSANIAAGATLSAAGGTGNGGQVLVNGATLDAAEGSSILANGAQGGVVRFNASQSASVAGNIAAIGALKNGGAIAVSGNQSVTIGSGATLSARGAVNGGSVQIYSGSAGTVAVDGTLKASGETGKGGLVVIKGGTSTEIGAGALVEMNHATNGGTLLVDTVNGVTNVGGTVSAIGHGPTAARTVTVKLLGKEVNLLSTALVDASSSSGGGTIYVGGGFQGATLGVHNALSTMVENGAVLRSDALESGAGGTVVVWANGTSEFHGAVSAEGVSRGGLVEVSGRQGLFFDGEVSTVASNGSAGVLLLDPTNFSISTAGSSASNLNNGTLQTQLSSNNVVVSTFDAGGSDPGHLTVTGRVAWNSAFGLTLLAEGDIYVANDLGNRGSGDVNLVAGWDSTSLPLSTILGGAPSSTPGSNNPASAVDMDASFFDTANFGAGNGSVYIGTSDAGVTGARTTVIVGSRTGQTNVAGFDVRVLGGVQSDNENQYAQIGYDHEDISNSYTDPVTGRIRVQAKNDVILRGGEVGGSLSGATNGDSGGAGRYAYGHIGHGGNWGSSRISLGGDIIVEAGHDVDGQAGTNRDASVQIGHGGSAYGRYHNPSGNNYTNVSGNITVDAGNAVSMRAGTGNVAYAMIGHGGREFRPTAGTGNIDVTAGAGGVTIKGGTGVYDANFAMIGHGGYSSFIANDSGAGDATPSRDYSKVGYTGTIDVTTIGGGDIDILGQGGDDGFAMIGHGGWDSDGNHGGAPEAGKITVSSSGALHLNAALGGAVTTWGQDDGFAQIGHGGRAVDGKLSGDVVVNVNGEATFLSGASYRQHVQLGHGGRDSLGAKEGVISLTTGGDIIFSAGSGEAWALLGHGGYQSSAAAGDPSIQGGVVGNIVVNSGGKIDFSAGTFDNSFVQLGHGGRATRSDNAGSITVTAKDSVLFTGGYVSGGVGGSSTRSGSVGYALLGHGGYDADSTNPGDNAAVITAAENPYVDPGGANGYSYAFDGYGPVGADTYSDYARFGPSDKDRIGNSGDITVTSLDGAVVFTAGDRDTNFAQIGHGGYVTDGDNTGFVKVYADVNRSGGGAALGENFNHSQGLNFGLGYSGDPASRTELTGGGEYFAGDILFDARGEDQNGPHYVQIGHGGYYSSGGHTGDIVVEAGRNITFLAGRDSSYAKVGHGGMNEHALNQADVNGTDDDNDVDDHVGTIGLESGSEDPPDNRRDFANDRYFSGTNQGDITVLANGDIRFIGFTRDSNIGGAGFVQIGHGGWKVDADPGALNRAAGHNGDITVQAGGLTMSGGRIVSAVNPNASITFESGMQVNSFAMVGNGGYESFGNHFGDIEVAAASHVDFHARGGSPTGAWNANTRAENSWVQIGNGGRNSSFSAALPRALESTSSGPGNGAVFGENSAFYINAVTLGTNVAQGNGAVVAPSGVAADGSGLPMYGQGSLQPLTTFNQVLVNPNTVRFVDDDLNPLTAPIPIIPPESRGNWYHIATPSAPRDAQGNPIIAMEGNINVTSLNGDTIFQGAGNENTPGAPGGETSPGSPTSTNGLGPEGARYSYVQVGHGGFEAGGDHGWVDLDGSGTADGNIAIRAEKGDFYLQGARAYGNDDPVAEWQQGMVYSYAQVGHGGARSGGTMSGDITVVAAGTARMLAGAGEQTYVQIGHGGYDASYYSGAGELAFEPDSRDGNAGNAGDRRGANVQNWYYPAYDIALDGSLAQSLGGYIRTDFVVDAAIAAGNGAGVGVPDINGRRSRELYYRQIRGDITVVGGNGVELRATDQGHGGVNAIVPGESQNSAPNSYALIGHGGRSTEQHTINANITVDASGFDPTNGNAALPGATGGAVIGTAGNSTESFVQIGHGGYDGDGNQSGSITVRAGQNADGVGVYFVGGTWNNDYAQIGHGGINAQSAGYLDGDGDGRGDHQGDSGDITVDSVGDVVFLAGSGHRLVDNGDFLAYALLGHGGYDADVRQSEDATATNYQGVAGRGIGHNGDITVASTKGSIYFSAVDINRATNNPTQSETIAAAVNSPGFGGGRFNFAQLGHGGYAAQGQHFGDITVYAGFDIFGNATNTGNLGTSSSDIVFLGGNSRGARVAGEHIAYAQLGHGGRSAQGDLGSRDANGNATETITVASGRDVHFGAGTGTENYAQLGVGGRDARGDHAMNIEVTAGRDLTFVASQADHLNGTGVFGINEYEHNAFDDASDASLGSVSFMDKRILPGSLTFTINTSSFAALTGDLTFVDVRDSATASTGTIQQTGSGTVVGTIDYNTGSVTFTTSILNSNPGSDDIIVKYQHADNDLGYVQLGNGGWDSDSGDNTGDVGKITVTTLNGGNVTFSSGPNDSYAQLGHGGRDTSGNHGQAFDALGNLDTAASKITLNADGAVAFGAYQGNALWGESNRAYVQLGHGGWTARGDMVGDIEVNAKGGISFTGGTGMESYAQLGHGGHDSDDPNNTSGRGNVGKITVTTGTGGDIVFTAGGKTTGAGRRSYAQLGHGGFDVYGNHGEDPNRTGDTTVSAIVVDSGGAIRFTAGPGVHNDPAGGGESQEAYALLGHGGHTARGDHLGNITVTAAGDIIFKASDSAPTGIAQLGHGGWDADDPNGGTASTGNRGDISVTTTNGGNIVFTAGSGTQNDNYAQLGHGGRATNGNHIGTIMVVGDGDLLFTGGLVNAYAQLGHGGVDAAGDFNGWINVDVKGLIDFKAGTADRGYTQLGHGGYHADDTTTTVGHIGNITVKSGGDINFTGGTAGTTYAQLGHGGHENDGDHSGVIVVDSGGAIRFAAGNGSVPSIWENMANLGHGGLRARGDHSGNITVTAVDNIELTGGTNRRSYAQIGHGGQDADNPNEDVNSVGMNGAITVQSTAGDILLTGGTGYESYTMIGHGGQATKGQNGSDGLSDIEIDAAGRLVLKSGAGPEAGGDQSGQLANAQIGQGGDDADGNQTANICIHVGEDVLLDSSGGNAQRTYTQIGNGGYSSGGNHSGFITVVSGLSGANGGIKLQGGIAGANDQYAMIGHGGTGSSGNHTGDITLIDTGGGGLTLQGGATGVSYALVGHGDGASSSSGTRAGNIYVDVDGAISVTTPGPASSLGWIGHQSTAANEGITLGTANTTLFGTGFNATFNLTGMLNQ